MKRVREGFLPLATLDPRATTPLRRQLYEWLRRSIAEGRLRLGQRIPSSRSLARELQVSRITVLAAYEQLLSEGYLQTFRGAGTCVAASIPEPLRPRGKRSAAAAGSASIRRPSRRARRLLALPEEGQLLTAGAFRVSQPALDRFPRKAWSRWVARHARASPFSEMAYGDPMGEAAFRSAIAEYLATVRGVRCDASQIMVTSGSQQGLQCVLTTLLDPGDAVWMEEPGYPGAHRALAIAGCEAVPVPVDDHGLNVEEGLRRRPSARAAYVTPSHQYPLGMTLSAGRRIQLLNWAQRGRAWILEDDYDSEYRFAGHPITSLQGLDVAHRVIYIGTFSKVLFPALRMGYLVIPKDLVPAFRATRDAHDIFAPALYQRALTDFMREGLFARHIRRMRTLYAERRFRMVQAIEGEFGSSVQIVGAEAGLHLVVQLPKGMDDKVAAQRASAAGIACIALSVCCRQPRECGGLILGYGGVDVARTREAVHHLALALRWRR
jgi:GntR family transcriptional regulator / MocR family aminotransferase